MFEVKEIVKYKYQLFTVLGLPGTSGMHPTCYILYNNRGHVVLAKEDEITKLTKLEQVIS